MLCALGREHIETKQQLQAYQPAGTLPFLQFPREVRGQTYRNALLVGREISLNLRSICLERSPNKVQSPYICLVNRQIHRESNLILYSNSFRFNYPEERVAFEERIGPDNRCLVHKISIHPTYLSSKTKNYNPYSEGAMKIWWEDMLVDSSLNHLSEITIDASYWSPPGHGKIKRNGVRSE